MKQHIIVIGGGPGGYTAAIRGTQLGAQVTLIEKDLLGGTCLNRGCIPTKTLYRSAEILTNLKHAEEFAITTSEPSIDGKKLKSRCDQVATQLRSGIEQLIKANAIQLLNGSARLVDSKTVEVTSHDGNVQQVTGDFIFLATGSVPATLDFPGSDLEGILTSDDLLKMDTIPKSMAVIGDGVISVEFATIYAAFGTEVEMLIWSKNTLMFLDSDLSKRFTASLKKKNVTIRTDNLIKSAEKLPNGKLSLTMNTKTGEEIREYDYLLIAVGRVPYTEGLGLDALGINYAKSGIEVDEAYRTNISNIYAIGDCIGGNMLAHWAAHQGITAVEHALGANPHLEAPAIPACIFTFPEIAFVGMTEDKAKELGIAYKTSKFMFAANGKALSLGEGEGFVKVVAAEDDTILGLHIMGPHASDLIHEGCLAISQKMKSIDFKHAVHAHPTLSESVYEAMMALNHEAIHSMPSKR